MEALILNGAAPGDAELDDIQVLLGHELESAGCRTKAMVLRDIPVAYCQGCFECWLKTPGICKTQDPGRDVAAAFVASDLVVLLTPITFGGYSSHLKKGLDRIAGVVSPFFVRIDGEVHHRPRYARYPRLLGVGVLGAPSPDEEGVFRTLVARNARNFHAPWHAARILLRGDAPATQLGVLQGALQQSGRAA